MAAPGLTGDCAMTEHTMAPAAIDLPDTPQQCQQRLVVLQDEIASIRVHIATNDIRRQTARKALDPDWFHRAKTALRLKQTEVMQLTAHMAGLGRRSRRAEFQDTLIDVVRADYGDDEWDRVLQRARDLHHAQELGRG